MKKYGMLVIVAMFIFTLTVVAQDQNPSSGWKGEKKEFKRGEKPNMTPEMRADKLAKFLELNNSQKTQVFSLIQKQDVERNQQMENFKKMRDKMKAQFKAQRKTNDEALAKIIGPEKFQKYEIMRAEHYGEMKGRMKERIGDRKEMHKNHFHNSQDESK